MKIKCNFIEKYLNIVADLCPGSRSSIFLLKNIEEKKIDGEPLFVDK